MVDLSVVHSDSAVFEKAGVNIVNEGRTNEAIRIEPTFCGLKIFHEWDEERDKKGSKLHGIREHRHVWTTWYLSPDGGLVGKNIAATTWQPIQGRVELATSGFHVV